MTSRTPQRALRLRRLRLVYDHDPDWPLGTEPVVPGVLEVAAGLRVHLLVCPDVVTLVSSLWNWQAYGARGQMLRPAVEPATTPGAPPAVSLEAVWGGGRARLLQLPLDRWDQEVSRLAGQAADVLTGAGEQGLLLVLAPALAGSRPASSRATR